VTCAVKGPLGLLLYWICPPVLPCVE
jgi:hypothetical protein